MATASARQYAAPSPQGARSPGPDRAVPRANAGGLAVPRSSVARRRRRVTRQLRHARFRAGAGTDGLRGPSRRRPFRAAAGGTALPDGRARLSPDEAARVLAGSGTRASGTAARRAPAVGAGGGQRHPADRRVASDTGCCRIRQPAQLRRLPPRGRTRARTPRRSSATAPPRSSATAPPRSSARRTRAVRHGRAQRDRIRARIRPLSRQARSSRRRRRPFVRVPTSAAMAWRRSGTVERRAYPRGGRTAGPVSPSRQSVQARRRCRGIRAIGSSSRRWQRHSAAVRPSSVGRRHLRRPGGPARRRRRVLGSVGRSALQSRIRRVTAAQRRLVVSAAAAPWRRS